MHKKKLRVDQNEKNRQKVFVNKVKTQCEQRSADQCGPLNFIQTLTKSIKKMRLQKFDLNM